MKKSSSTLLLLFFLTIHFINSQEKKDSKFSFIGFGGTGNGIVKNDSEPNYNLNSNSGEFLINYKLNQKFGIATGIGFNELSGNGFNTIGNFYHERRLFKIPLLVTATSKVSENFIFFANFGFFTQNIIKDEYRFLNETQKGVYNGWNFGGQMGIGFLFQMFDNFSAGMNYNGQSDFSKFKLKNNGFNDAQKMKNLNTVGVILIVKL